MLGNFTFYNPVKLHFGKDALNFLHGELLQYGPRVLLCYGGGSIKRNGIYDKVMQVLRDAGKTVVEDPGVMPNPTIGKLREGARLARENDVDLILAVGGGSVIDYAKGVSASAWCEEDPWQKYYLRQEEPSCRTIPVGSVLTMVGTGSEMNGGSVITNPETHQKIGKVFQPGMMPRFSILNPEFTFSLPKWQMAAGMFDIMSHLLEQYLSGTDDNTSDYIGEGLMRSLVHASRIASANPLDYEARSNIMWTATMALNTMTKMGKSQDWMVHMIGQSIGAFTDATHGMTLSAVSGAYYRHILPYGVEKFARFARNVWEIRPEGKTQEELALQGIEALESWMDEIGVVRHISEIGVTEEMIGDIAANAIITTGGYKTLSTDDIVKILHDSL